MADQGSIVMQQPVPATDFQSSAGSQQGTSDEIDLLEVARALWRGKIWIVLCIVVALSLGWYMAFVAATPLYTATARMALEISSPPVIDLEAVASGFSGEADSINTEMEIVRSGHLLGQLVDELDLMEDPEFNGHLIDPLAQPSLLARARSEVRDLVGSGEDLLGDEEPVAPPPPQQVRHDVIEAVREAISTNVIARTFVFTISATTTDPEKSMLLANTLAELYREDQLRLKTEAAVRAAAWLSEQVSNLRAELDSRESRIAEFRAGSTLVSSEGVGALSARATELQASLEEAQRQLARMEERVAALQAADELGDIEARVAAAEDGQLEAAAADIAAAESGAELRFDRRFAQLLLQAEAELERAQEQVEELERTVGELSTQFEDQSAELLELQDLEQEAEATRVLYEMFLRRLEEATVQQSIHEADSRILTEAALGEQVSPRKGRILALSLLLGLMVGAGLVLLREFLQNTFRTAAALEQYTGRPVLGQIPRIPASRRGETIRYLLNKPTSAAAEAIRNLRTSLLLSNVDRPPRVIMTTSSVPGEGKTTVAIALALNLAGLDKRVLLIEGDIRRRTFDAYFRHSKQQAGVISVVSGKTTLEEAVLRPGGLSIDVLIGERSPINAADLFSSQKFEQLLEQARAKYDFVVIDTPPVLIVPDARVIAQHVDAAVFVVHWDSTPKSRVEEGLRQFRSATASITGLVLSRIDPKGMKRYGYGGAYGPYSRAARRYYDA